QGEAIPVVVSITVPDDGTYTIGDILTFTVTFNQPITLTGEPYIPVTIGTQQVQATYVDGSETNTLTFRYTVKAGDQADAGINLGSAIEGGDFGPAVRTLNNVPSTAEILIDGGDAPEITSTPTLTTPYGQPYSYSILATGDELLPTIFSAEVLPDWLDFSAEGQNKAVAFVNIPDGKGVIGVAGDGQGNTFALTSTGTEIYKIAPDGATTLWKSGLQATGTVYALHIADGYIYIPRHSNSTNSITRIPLDNPAAT